MPPRHERALAALRATGAGALLAADPGTVAWLTGCAAAIEAGPSPFALGPFAVMHDDGTVVLVASEDDAAPDGCEVVRFAGFTTAPLDRLGNARAALAPLLRGRTVAIEAEAVAAGLVAGVEWVDVGDRLERARAVKDPDELQRLRAAIALCDAGQAALRRELTAGRTELELWSSVRGAIERAAGQRVPVLADLASGPRTGDVGGAPGDREVAEGDLVICDLVPRLDGVWGDSCATLAVGEPSAWAVAAHGRCREALELAIAAVRPGAAAAAIDALVRERLDFPHHTGHGIGAAQHELPRIVPASASVLETGMVIALEPGLYGDGEGVRVEQVVLVTGDGCELLSGHDLALT